MNRLLAELSRVFGDPPVAPTAVVRVQVSSGQGMQAGREEADRLVDAGAELVVLDSTGTSPAVQACLAVLLGKETSEVVDRQAADWTDQIVAVRALLRDARTLALDIAALIDHLDDAALGRLTGLIAQLTTRRTPVLLGGGSAVTTAMVLAQRLDPGCEGWVLAGSAPADPLAREALRLTGLSPILDLGLGQSGASIAVAVVRTALEEIGA